MTYAGKCDFGHGDWSLVAFDMTEEIAIEWFNEKNGTDFDTIQQIKNYQWDMDLIYTIVEEPAEDNPYEDWLAS